MEVFKEMERSGGMVTGSHERNELVRVRHRSDSGVRSSGSVSTFFLRWTFLKTMFPVFLFGSGSFVLSVCAADFIV